MKASQKEKAMKDFVNGLVKMVNMHTKVLATKNEDARMGAVQDQTDK